MAFCGSDRCRAVVEEPEHRRAGARHAGKAAARRRAHRRQRLADRRRERDRGGSRSLRPPAMTATSRDRSIAGSIVGCGERCPALSAAQRPEHRRGRDRNAGVHEHGEERRQAQGRAEHLARPRRSCGRAIEGTPARRRRFPRRRQDRRIVSGEAVEAGEQAQRRGGIGGAAAEAGRDRQPFRQMESARAAGRGCAARAPAPP